MKFSTVTVCFNVELKETEAEQLVEAVLEEVQNLVEEVYSYSPIMDMYVVEVHGDIE